MAKSKPRIFIFTGILLLAGVFAGGYYWLFGDLPSLTTLPANLNPPSVRIEDRFGRLLYEVLPEETGRHTTVPLEQIPLALRQATIATEDQSFYVNPGVDLRGILRSLWIDLRGGETVAGGSTITQQVARNLLLEEERTERSLRRKLRESLLAWQLTRRFSKDEILGLYMNQTYYGGLSFGVEAAAQTFFGKPAAELDLAESAILAGLPQAPALYNPFTDLEAAKTRQAVVLDLMEKQGYITTDQRLLAEHEPLVLASTPYPMEAPHFVLMVESQLDEIFTPEEINSHNGVIVRTTLNLDWQHLAERAIQRQIEELKNSKDGLGHNVNSAALVALDPTNGEILALVGSPDYFNTDNAGALNMALSPRQPGSAIKPIMYSAVLDPTHPQPWTAATMILDVTTTFATHDGKAYTPTNYDGLEHGPVLLRQALASSLNIPAVATLNHLGVESMLDQAARLGITTLSQPADYDLSLALGVGEVRLIDLTAAFGVFANQGYRLTPQAILEITDSQGEILYTPQPAPQTRVIDQRVAWLISDILSDDSARALGFGSGSVLNLDRPAAVKTGTTTNFHDNWTVGYTPDLVVGVWAGNTNNEAMRDVTGLTGAAPIWHEFMRAVLTGKPETTFQQPPGLVQVEICTLSGLLPTEECPYHRWEWFINGTQPVTYDTIYKLVTIDRATGKLADASTPLERQTQILVLDLPPQAHPWARTQGLTLLSDLLPTTSQGSSVPPQSSALLSLLSPAANSVYQITPTLPLDAQRLLVEAAAASGVQQVTLWVDGTPIGVFNQPPYQAWWTLSPGTHQAWAEGVMENGEQVTTQPVTFDVSQ
jgi:1A family penicillin-binding protein